MKCPKCKARMFLVPLAEGIDGQRSLACTKCDYIYVGYEGHTPEDEAAEEMRMSNGITRQKKGQVYDPDSLPPR